MEREKQNFENYPELAKHIERMASTGRTGTGSQWCDFLRNLNKALSLYNVEGQSEQSEKITKIKYPIGNFAPGSYVSRCVSCEQKFMGDKYARECEPCAINTVNESNTKALAELRKLKTALKQIKFSNDTINEALQHE